MKVLGLESSGKVASVAITENGQVLAEFMLNAGVTHSQTFLPMLDHILQLSNISLDSVDGLAVSQGPGSYTGLRIGIATAKGLALAKKIPVIPISTLHGLAQNISDFRGRIFALLFARAEELYYAEYRAENGEVSEVVSPQILLLPEILKRIREVQDQGQTTALVGDGVWKFENIWKGNLLREKLFIPAPIRHYPSAASISLLGEREMHRKKAIPGSRLIPVYLKKTQAEREIGE